jgi:hypothetical protein
MKHRERSRSILVGAIALALAMVACGGDDEAVSEAPAEPATTAAATTAAPTTTITTLPDTSEVEALVEEYYAAYNAGDADTALGLLSSVAREVSPANVRFWVGTLGEQVDASCAPAIDTPGAIVCRETYTDLLHGPAGESTTTMLIYFARNGKLQQIHDQFRPFATYTWPGCQGARCPGRWVGTEGDTWAHSYQLVEADLMAWLEGAYPEAAAAVEDARRLGYFAGDEEAIAAALPHVEEFVAQSDEWGESDITGADLDSMTPLQAVEAMYTAINSHDAGTFEAFFGAPPNGFWRWLWAMGRHWNAECSDTDDSAWARCEGEIVDDFYTKAGAVWEYTQLATIFDGELFVFMESVSGTDREWPYHDFEHDMAAWMADAYPEDAAAAFIVGDIVHSPEGAAIAVSYLDEFLEASDDYPRDPEIQTEYMLWP